MYQPIAIDPPIRGRWAIFNPPGHPRLAFDFLAVDERKRPYKGVSLWRHVFGHIEVENTLAWGQPVHAVLPGRVVAASDGAPDRKRLSMIRDLVCLMLAGRKPRPSFSDLGGNHVVLDCGGVFPLYAHLQCGSVKVLPGQTVEAGEALGAVGNSGASLQPHLHFQLMSSSDPLPLFQNLVPMAFAHVRCWKGDRWHDQIGHVPRNGDHYLVP